jgi:protein transport protein SEC31
VIEAFDTQRTISTVETGGPGYEVTATGSAAGAVGLWRTQYLLDRPKQAYIKEDMLFSTPVKALAFCPSKPSLLAAASNEVLILNVEQAMTTRNSDDYTFSPGQTPEKAEGSMVASIAWNPKVQYIFAAVAANGATAVWDLRNTKLLFDVSDLNYYKRATCTGLEWNPEIPTQFVLTYDDDQAPFLQVWDLRYQGAPVKDMRAHTEGITSLSWSPDDSALLMSCDRGGKAVVWNFKTGEPISHFETLEHSTKSQWVPQHYGAVSFLNSEGRFEVRSMYSPSLTTRETVLKVASSKLRPETGQGQSYAPKWISGRGGACFNLNGTLVAFSEKSSNILIRKTAEGSEDLKQRLATLKAFTAQEDYLPMTEHLSRTAPDTEKLELKMLGAQLQGRSAHSVLEALGLDPAKIMKETELFTGKKKSKVDDKPSKKADPVVSFTNEQMSAGEVEDFFNSAGQPPKAAPKVSSSPMPAARVEEFKQTLTETISRNSNWDEGGERLIKENLLVHNLECAIDCALACGRTAEALIIAEQGGSELFEKTKQAVLSTSKDLFLRTTFHKLITKDNATLIQEIPLDKWQEALALCLTHSPAELERLADDLGSRLLSERSLEHAAASCFILARQFEKVLHIWINRARRQLNRLNRLYVFQELVSKTLALREACQHRQGSERQDRLILEYAELLIGEGLVDEALDMVSIGSRLGNSHQASDSRQTSQSSQNLQLWMERLSKHRNSAAKVKIPWEYFNVKPVRYAEVPRQAARGGPGLKAANPFPEGSVYESKPIESSGRPSELLREQARTAPFAGRSGPVATPPTTPVLTKSPFPESLIKTAPPISQVNPSTTPPIAFRGAESGSANREPPKRSDPPPSFPIKSQVTPAHVAFPSTPTVHPPPTQAVFPPPTQAVPPPPTQAVFPPPPANIISGSISPTPPVRPPPQPEYSNPSPFIPQTPYQNPSRSTLPPPSLPTRGESLSLPPPPIPPVASRPQVTVPPPAGLKREVSHQDLDISGIPSEYKRLAQVWKDAVNVPAVTSNQRLKRETEGKLQELMDKLSQREFDEGTIGALSSMTEAFESGDMKAATALIFTLSQTAWDSNKNWLTAVKRLVQLKSR